MLSKRQRHASCPSGSLVDVGGNVIAERLVTCRDWDEGRNRRWGLLRKTK